MILPLKTKKQLFRICNNTPCFFAFSIKKTKIINPEESENKYSGSNKNVTPTIRPNLPVASQHAQRVRPY
ncbi:hypothetical protein BpHYR1_002212 [Brachionus plicatilis]|uniref:Uncharacterized protein n=1 Tax=Brachionus plicatilis TaxID=10195 RepID=A0A3M7SKW7_BRAPC|nr:hypothetical protein BpHYR1_002212 [Brachionus plicatilis]